MKFRANYEDIELVFEAIKEKDLNSIHKNYILEKEDYNDFESGAMALFSIIITSTKNGETLTHYLPGRPLSTDEEELLEELDILIEEESILSQISECWGKYDLEDGPSWKK